MQELLERITRGEAEVAEIAFLLQHPHYAERPVDIETFVNDSRYLGLKNVIRPAVMDDLQALFSEPTSFADCPYEEAVFDEAIGSGKTFKTSIIVAYVLHHLLCLREPQRFFNLDPSSMIAVMNMSVNALQARKVVFGEIRNRVANSPWFANHRPDPNIHSELRFEKNVTVIPGHSGVTYPLGYNLLVAVMDEAAFYTETEEHDVAEDMFYAIKRRIQTRFGKHGLLVMISSPRYTDDFIERKMKEAEEGPQRIFARRRAIWEVLPEDQAAIAAGETFELGGVRVPLRYQDDFTRNPEAAWRDLGAKPSLVLEPYFKQFELVKQCIDPRLRDPILPDGRLADWFRGDQQFTYFGHVDLGLTRDACGLSVTHRVGDEVKVDLIHRIQGSREKEVDLDGVANLFIDLKKRGFDFGLVTYDQYQSAASIQRLRKNGIESETLSVDATLAPYETLKELCYSGRLRFYRHEVFLRELERLELREGRKVDHPPRGSKDVSDAVAGAVYNAIAHEELEVPMLRVV